MHIDPFRLYISNYPGTMAALRNALRKYTDAQEIHQILRCKSVSPKAYSRVSFAAVRHEYTQRLTGDGYIVFNSKKSASEALHTLNGTQVNGYTFHLQPFRSQYPQCPPPPKDIPKKTIPALFFSNYYGSVYALRQALKGYGSVVSIKPCESGFLGLAFILTIA